MTDTEALSEAIATFLSSKDAPAGLQSYAATLAAETLVQALEAQGFVIMKRAPVRQPSTFDGP